MELEDYLIEEKPTIIAISFISNAINNIFEENFYEIKNGKSDKELLENIMALNSTIIMLSDNMRIKIKSAYKEVEKSYAD